MNLGARCAFVVKTPSRSQHKTVVPAKAGIQEILPEKSDAITECSGFRLLPERRLLGVGVAWVAIVKTRLAGENPHPWFCRVL